MVSRTPRGTLILQRFMGMTQEKKAAQKAVGQPDQEVPVTEQEVMDALRKIVLTPKSVVKPKKSASLPDSA